MCYLLYGTLIVTFILFSDAVIAQFGLCVPTPDGPCSVVALGWEIAAEMWPLLVVAAVFGSAVTYFATGRLRRQPDALPPRSSPEQAGN